MKVRATNLTEYKQAFIAAGRMLNLVWQTDKWLFLGSFIVIMIPGITPFINIYIYKLIIDLVVHAATSSSSFNFTQLYLLLGFRILSLFVTNFSFRTQFFIERLLWSKVPIRLNQLIFEKTSSLDMYYFENDKFRDLLEKVRDAHQARPQRLVSNAFLSFQSLLEVVIAFALLVKLNPWFVVLILITAVPEFLDQANRSKFAYGIWDGESSMRKKYYYLTRVLQDYREIKEIKLFRLASRFLSQIHQVQSEFYHNNKKLAKDIYLSGLVFSIFQTLVYIGIEVYVIFQAIARKVTVGDIAFYTSVVTNFQNGLAGLLRNVNEVIENGLFVSPIFELLSTEPMVVQNPNPVKLDLSTPPKIEFKEVSFAYPNSTKKVLNKLSLTIQPGEKVAFVGENGAGKTTLIKLLVRFYDVTEGEILINGINLKDLDLSSWYAHVGVLFQDFNRYDFTATENIHMGKVDADLELENIVSAAQSAGAHKMIADFDKGYDQMLGKVFEEGIELSGGQWQKIALARAFFRSAPILVLDEPTASIDAKAESEIFSRVERLSKDKTVIIISHRFSTVRNADKIYVFDDGKVAESGSHSELMKKDGHYAELFKLQAKGYQ
jgi:ATP-binding cassette subfamily B protein